MKIVSNGKTLEVPSGVSQDIYSLEEQVVGRWIDGRPLYSRTYFLETGESRTDLFWQNINISIENVDKVIDISATIRSSDDFTVALPYAISRSAVMIGYNHAPYNSICVLCMNAPTLAERQVAATFKYTKTTDQATIELPAGLTVSQPAYIAAPQSAASAELRAETKHEEV